MNVYRDAERWRDIADEWSDIADELAEALRFVLNDPDLRPSGPPPRKVYDALRRHQEASDT